MFSAGGMFGAWQAGAWMALAELVQPDVVVGASVGSLNAWMVAGATPPELLARRWLELDQFAHPRWRMPRRPLGGCIDTAGLETIVREAWETVRPVTPVGITTTELPWFRPVLHRDTDITWRHLMASCAVLGLLPQQRLDGRLHSDGGLLNAVPIWAAAAMGATRILALNVMPRLPAPVRIPLLALRRVRGARESGRQAAVLSVAPVAPLGGWREIAAWSRGRTERWIEDGQTTVRRQRDCIEQFLYDMFYLC